MEGGRRRKTLRGLSFFPAVFATRGEVFAANWECPLGLGTNGCGLTQPALCPDAGESEDPSSCAGHGLAGALGSRWLPAFRTCSVPSKCASGTGPVPSSPSISKHTSLKIAFRSAEPQSCLWVGFPPSSVDVLKLDVFLSNECGTCPAKGRLVLGRPGWFAPCPLHAAPSQILLQDFRTSHGAEERQIFQPLWSDVLRMCATEVLFFTQWGINICGTPSPRRW